MISDRVRAIYLRARELPAEEWAGFVARHCGDDEEAREEVMSLLAVVGEADEYFDALSEKISLSAMSRDDKAEVAQRIGPWRLLRVLGRGGMGAVYLAERVDDQFEHRAALKLLPLGADSEMARERFLGERQILARLVHENIARLLDGGISDDGSPWFAMDYVEGLPIDDFCNRHSLTVHERLRLLLDVAGAVQYAHGNLVVHRDLKPANVLVEAGGKVRLLDFGIAKVLEPAGHGPAVTQQALRPVTPAFASPEMLRGEPVDVTTDVYSIGVLTYLLLTGELPLTYDGLTLPEMHAHVAQTIPPPIREIDRDLDEDLEAIVGKALAKTPAERYQSVEGLAADLRAYLDGQPVGARVPTAWYRAARFAGRHRLGLTFAGFALVSLATITGVAVHSAVTAERQARHIAQERDKAQETKEFLIDIFELSGPNRSKGLAVTARELLDEGTRGIRNELAAQPAVRAELLDAIAQIYLELSALDEALVLFEEAGALYAALPEGGDAGLARTLQQRAYIAERQGDYEAAEALAVEAVSRFRELNDRDALGASLVTLGRIEQRRGERDQAEVHFLEALAIHRALHGDVHASIARDLTHLGALMMHKGDYAAAEAMHRDALAMRRDIYDAEHTSLIDSLHNLAQVLNFQGQHEQALKALEEALHISRALLREGDSSAFFLLSELAATHRKMGNLEGAERGFREALAVLDRFFDEDHPEHAMVRAQLGRIALEQGDAAAAEPLLSEGIRRLERNNPGHPFLPDIRVTLGTCLLKLDRYEQAATLVEGSLEQLRSAVGPDHPRTQFALATLVAVHEASGDLAQARKYRAMKTKK